MTRLALSCGTRASRWPAASGPGLALILTSPRSAAAGAAGIHAAERHLPARVLTPDVRRAGERGGAGLRFGCLADVLCRAHDVVPSSVAGQAGGHPFSSPPPAP